MPRFIARVHFFTISVFLTLIGIAGAFASIAAGISKASDSAHTLAVIPQQPATVVRQAWLPLVEQLSLATGKQIELKTYQSFPDFEADLRNGVPDFVYLSPFHQFLAAETQGYRPMVRDGSENLIGIIVVPVNSDVQNMQDLDGAQLSFPSPTAFGASLYLRAMLRNHEGIHVTPHYVGSHGNVYRSIVHGDVQAGGGVNKTLENEPPALRKLLRIVYQTPGLATHPISAHPRVPNEVQKEFETALLRFGKTDAGKTLLENIGIKQPVRAHHERDYAHLGQLGLSANFINEQTPNNAGAGKTLPNASRESSQ